MGRSTKKATGTEKRNSESSAVAKSARVRVIGARGISTGNDFAEYMSAVMSDLVEGNITPQIANAACNAGGKLLKAVELQFKYGRPTTTKTAAPTFRGDIALV